MKRLRSYSIFTRPDSLMASSVAEEIRGLMKQYGLEEVGVKEADLLFVVGGDGTFLHAMKNDPKGLIFPIKLGRVGFFYEVDVTNFREYIKLFFEGGHYRIAQYKRIRFLGFECVNEHYITSRNSGKVVSVAIYADGELYRRGLADGIMIATPLASTAYSLSVGGPLVDPALELAIINVVSPLGGPIPSLVVSDPSKVLIEVYPDRRGQKLVTDGIDRKEFNALISERPTRGDKFRVIRFGDTGIKRVVRAWSKLSRWRYR